MTCVLGTILYVHSFPILSNRYVTMNFTPRRFRYFTGTAPRRSTPPVFNLKLREVSTKRYIRKRRRTLWEKGSGRLLGPTEVLSRGRVEDLYRVRVNPNPVERKHETILWVYTKSKIFIVKKGSQRFPFLQLRCLTFQVYSSFFFYSQRVIR